MNRSSVMPLPTLLLFTWLNSISAAVATLGIFFLTRSAFAFSATENFQLGIVLGITYVIGAWFAGSFVRALERRFPRLEPRMTMGLVVLAMAVSIVLPRIFVDTSIGRWMVYVSIGLYSPLSGMLWPLVESYLSGGRAGPELRSASGRFSVTWSSANALSMWLIAPFLERSPLMVLPILAAIHLATLLLLKRFPPRASLHLDDHTAEHAEDHPEYVRLLRVHRVLLAASYVVMFALTPYLPVLCGRLGVDPAWQAPLTSVWMIVRIAAFGVLGAWHGWHGRGATAFFGCATMLLGFAFAVLSPLAPPGALGIGLFAVGLAMFGVGVAVLYSAALYYALEVETAEVDAGGKHEALVGAGYTIGPLCGLVAATLAPGGTEDVVMLSAVVVIVIMASGHAWRSARRPIVARG